MKASMHAIYWLAIIFVGLTVRMYCNDGGPCPEVAPVVQKVPKIITDNGKAGYTPVPKATIHHSSPRPHTPIAEPIPDVPVTITREPAPNEDLLDAYYSENVYQEEYTDSAITIKETDTVSENKIQSRLITYQWKLPPPPPVQVKKNRYFVGWKVDAGRNGFTSTGPSMLYVNKRDQAMAVQYDILNDSYGVTGYIPLKFPFFRKK